MRLFSRVHATLQPALSVGRSVGRSVGHILLFFMILFIWPHCTCPNGLVTSNMAPAHLHATSTAMYPALFTCTHVCAHSLPRACACARACHYLQINHEKLKQPDDLGQQQNIASFFLLWSFLFFWIIFLSIYLSIYLFTFLFPYTLIWGKTLLIF